MSLTRREAAIISAYTGVLMSDFDALHEYVEEVMERPVFTHEMGDKATAEEIKARSRSDFIALCEQVEGANAS